MSKSMSATESNSHRLVYDQLLSEFRQSASQPAEFRWQYLTAAHIVGQNDFRLHCHVHAIMFAYAVRLRDWAEAGGQLFRLSLVPLGHLLGRLPAGNIGRASVNAFQPMPLSPQMKEIIVKARSQVVAQGKR